MQVAGQRRYVDQYTGQVAPGGKVAGAARRWVERSQPRYQHWY